MDMTRAQDWLDTYIAAWRSGDRQHIGDLFSEEVRYRYHPYDEPVMGRQAIVQSWLEDWDPKEPWEADYRVYAVDGSRVVATGTSRYPAYRDHPERLYHNVFLIQFDEEGRCRDFTEYFVKQP
jgi:hypothetical protein